MNYANNDEMIASMLKLYDFGADYSTAVNVKWFRENDGVKVYEGNWTIPSAVSQGNSYWSWYAVISWIGKALWEINNPGIYRCEITATGGPISGIYKAYFRTWL